MKTNILFNENKFIFLSVSIITIIAIISLSPLVVPLILCLLNLCAWTYMYCAFLLIPTLAYTFLTAVLLYCLYKVSKEANETVVE